MKSLLLVAALAAGAAALFLTIPRERPATTPVPDEKTSVHRFTLRNIDGVETRLGDYKGKVVMIVNTASRCGLTPQYEGLQRIYDKYRDRGFVVLGFPANNFLGQEPGTDKEIKDFCTLNYKVTFPMFSKISVKGDEKHELYRFLTDEASNPGFGGEITWNFEKFLADRDGRIVARFAPKIKPDDASVVEAIEKQLEPKQYR
jgi:glutathione peroxidase